MSLNFLNRKKSLFSRDINSYSIEILNIINNSSFLIIGGAGTIGKAVIKELFSRNPKLLHVIDINENGLAELVRDLRSSIGYSKGEFKTFVIDLGSKQFNLMYDFYGPYDYVLNFSALKHVRSEKDQFTLLRMIEVNILNNIKIINHHKSKKIKNFFCVSSDKASNPENMMGASKKIMEKIVFSQKNISSVSSARFANVTFSQGSLLESFVKRFELSQPIVAPKNVLRYFLNENESGELCLLSTILGQNREIFIPNLYPEKDLYSFHNIAKLFLQKKGFNVYECDSEEEARKKASSLIKKKQWPCFFFETDTTGEKIIEEFYEENEKLNKKKFRNISIIENNKQILEERVNEFLISYNKIIKKKNIHKEYFVDLFKIILDEFNYKDLKKYLDSKM